MGPGDRPTLPTAATVIERRDTASTVFGNVLDLSGAKAGAVKDVTQHGDRESGFGLLRIETRDGVDLCFASYQPGSIPRRIETDALQAMAQMKGPSPRALYLGGGTILKVGDAILQRSEEGLASIEVGAKGGYLLANPSPSPATITVTLKALEGLEAFDLDGQGQPKGKAKVVAKGGGAISARSKPAAASASFRRERPDPETGRDVPEGGDGVALSSLSRHPRAAGLTLVNAPQPQARILQDGPRASRNGGFDGESGNQSPCDD